METNWTYYASLLRRRRLYLLLLIVIAISSLTSVRVVEVKLRTLGLRRSWARWSLSSWEKGAAPEEQACIIPKLQPGDAKLRELDWKSAPKNTPPKCFQRESLFSIDLDRTLNTNQNHSLAKGIENCYFRPVVRDRDQPEFHYLNATTVYRIKSKAFRLPEAIQHIHVWCENGTEGSSKIYEDYLSAVQPKPELEKVLEERERGREGDELWSVLLMAQDSCSHMNFQRYQLEVHKYLLEELGAIEFHGFNSLGAGTHPNIFTLLTGLPLKEYKENCFPGLIHFENCSYIWKEFAARGYRTGYTEDFIHEMGIFNYKQTRGFTRPTFDYDFREVVHFLESPLVGHENDYESMFCHGSRLKYETVLDHTLKMASAFPDKPYWFFSWGQSLTHYSNPLALYAKDLLLFTVKKLKENKLLARTILILYSDHGFTRGDFRRSSRQGFLEDRLPMLYIALPPAFRANYPLAVRNMEGNVHRLTSMHDLHATMKDLLQPKSLEDDSVRSRATDPSLTYSRAVSLFLPVSPGRTCDTIPFENMYCACLDRKEVSVKEDSVRRAANDVLEEINRRLAPHPQCQQLHLVTITQAYQVNSKQISHEIERARFDTKKEGADKLGVQIEVEIETQPGNGAFYSSVSISFDRVLKTSSKQFDILRVNTYGADGDCAPNKQLQPMCYCKGA